MSDQTLKPKRKRRIFFNIDAMARKFYPFSPVVSPNRTGVDSYVMLKIPCINPRSAEHYRGTMLKRA